MATRNLTEAFVLMRNNALQTKHIYAEQNLSDRMALVGAESIQNDGVELRRINLGISSPPVWIDTLEEAQYILSRLRVKIDNLIELHSRHVTRPTLDDKSQEEKQMEQLTRDISKAFANGYKQVKIIKNAAVHEQKYAERQLANSAVTALSVALQELAIKYRTAQNKYLQQINSREERSRQFMLDQVFVENGSSEQWLTETPADNENDSSDYYWQAAPQQIQLGESVLLQLEEAENNIKMAGERQNQVGHIVQSISELNHIFKDLSHVIQEQGTVLDRIDYNIEQTQLQVTEGYKQLRKADLYQRSNRKMYCIFILASAIVFLSFLLIMFKT